MASLDRDIGNETEEIWAFSVAEDRTPTGAEQENITPVPLLNRLTSDRPGDRNARPAK
jgi:hypothetical protein